MKRISINVPCYNEEENIRPFYEQIARVIKTDKDNAYELVYVNDGSTDKTLGELQRLAKKHHEIKLVNLSRNFGKEIATTAGIHEASGDALIMIDADGQHPPELIPELIDKWQKGAHVVVGVRKSNQKEGAVKKYGSKIFYSLLNHMADATLVPGATDYRLIDKIVRSEFVRMTERSRITRGLIDWLGFKHEYVEFAANARMSGSASYSFSKLLKLALTSFVSLSLKPLYFSVYAGLVVLPFSIILLVFSVIEMASGDPLGLNITGSAYIALTILMLVGVLLVSQGIIAIYLSHIHIETQNRPLFVIDNTHNNSEKIIEEL